MTARSYIGEIGQDGKAIVFIVHDNGAREVLPPRLDLRNHSPDGFAWGYGGSGPSQLALAILAHAIDVDFALAYYQAFKWQEIAFFDQSEPWAISAQSVRDWARQYQETIKRQGI